MILIPCPACNKSASKTFRRVSIPEMRRGGSATEHRTPRAHDEATSRGGMAFFQRGTLHAMHGKPRGLAYDRQRGAIKLVL